MNTQKILLLLVTCGIFASCNKWAEDKSNLSKYVVPAPTGGVISDSTPLSGSIKGVMLAGKTYTLGGDIIIPRGDTLLIQSGVTINVTNSAGIVVHGVLASIGTKDAPNVFTVPGVRKNNTPNLPIDQDSAHIGLWRGIMCDTSCTMLVLKWTHIDFAGANYGTADGAQVNESAGTSFNILFQNPNGYFIMEDCWLYGGTDDAVRISSGKIHLFRNTMEKCGGSGGDILNCKGGTVGTMGYNFFIGTAYNGQKASNKGQGVGAPQTNIVMYNTTFVNGGVQIVPGARAGGIDFEQGAAGAFFNNVFINCRVGYRVVNNPVADTAHLTYGYNYQWADSLVIADQFFTFGGVCTKPMPTDLPNPSTYLPANFYYPNPPANAYDGTPAVQQLNPEFVNYPLPVVGEPLFAYTAIGSFDFHLSSKSALIGKGTTTAVAPMTVVPMGAIYGASEVTPPGADLGCYQINGSGNQH
ncbi:hypothetical protein [Dinghuibacter silviterrae]|uniref:Parallel beta helix pectate lyase-like protein n=1 Tax=Dinghuibacter silviterrae TaxID=1539049 RepID=A0A4R8DR49_9BACT|nr:hypothetical protein [Dinghuibacter silviterrae]TDW99600.1 hypothetical protein EDB95_0610 [Dinghuibacter silviterrae]